MPRCGEAPRFGELTTWRCVWEGGEKGVIGEVGRGGPKGGLP